jgi:hypothetical protein
VLHDESHPKTSRPVRTSEADEIIDDRVDILRLDRCVRPRGSGAMRPPAVLLPPAARQIGAVPPYNDATLLWLNDLFEDEIQFNQNPSQQRIFLQQRVHLVAVFVTPE